MRNLHTSTPVGLVTDKHSSEANTILRANNHTSASSVNLSHTSGKSRNGYSQQSRSSVMQKNVQDASLFIDEQKRVLKELIKEIQIFIGYREQLPLSHNDSVNQHSWSVYLMHAQSLQSAMKKSVRGKDLFGDGTHPPIRFHLERNGEVIPFDLPDPCLISMISIRAFISGVSDHKLPSAELGNACIAELLNALIEVQHGSEKLHKISRELKNKKQVSANHDLHSNSSSREPKPQISWGQKLMGSFYSAIRFSIPINS